MSNHLCKKCFFYDEPLCSYQKNVKVDTDICKYFKAIPQTVFQQITTSPEVLAPQFIFKQWHAFDGKWGWFSLLLMDGDTLDSPWFESYEEAYAATVAKLKEVAE